MHLRRLWLRPTLAAGLIIAVAGSLRLALALAAPDEFSTWRDAQHYVALARSLVEGGVYHDSVGDWPGEPPYSDVGPTSFWLPGYPSLIALVIGLLGDRARYLFVAQAVLSTGTVWLCYESARRLMPRGYALVAAGLMAVNPTSVWLVVQTAAGTLSSFIVALTLFLAIQCHTKIAKGEGLPRGYWAGLVAVMATGALVRTVFVFVGLGVSIYLLGSDAGRRKQLVSLLAPVFIGLIVAAAILTPWLARNHSLWGEWVYHTKSGLNLVIGFNEEADGRFDYEFAGVPRLDTAALDELERDKELRRHGLAWMRDNPYRSISLALGKLVLFWDPIPRYAVGVKKWVGASWSILFLGLALTGCVWICWNRSPWLPLVIVASYVLPLSLAFAITRFRLPLDPVLAILAAYGVRMFLRRGARIPGSRSRIGVHSGFADREPSFGSAKWE